jgi:hypothetical protein
LEFDCLKEKRIRERKDLMLIKVAYGVLFAVATVAILAMITYKVTRPEDPFEVLIVVDEEYYEQRGSTFDAWLLEEEVSDFFQEEFGIKLETPIVSSWKSYPKMDPLPEGTLDLIGTRLIMESLKQSIVPPKNGYVLALTGQDLTGRNPGGALTTQESGRYAMVWANGSNPVNAAIHEVAHLFGAKHPIEAWGADYMEEHPSVMSPHLTEKVRDFDPKNREILKERKLRTYEELTSS